MRGRNLGDCVWGPCGRPLWMRRTSGRPPTRPLWLPIISRDYASHRTTPSHSNQFFIYALLHPFNLLISLAQVQLPEMQP